MSDFEIRRGDIVWVNCEPSVGVEPNKTRTCVVVSNDVANQFGEAITVVPTQQYSAERVHRAFIVDLRRPRSSLRADRVANASMIMTYDRSRIIKREGRVTKDTLVRIDGALRTHLGLDGAPPFH